MKDNGEGDPQDAHLGRAAEVQDEDWDKAQSSASSKRGGCYDDFSKIISPNVVVITIKNNNEYNMMQNEEREDGQTSKPPVVTLKRQSQVGKCIFAWAADLSNSKCWAKSGSLTPTHLGSFKLGKATKELD